MGQEVIILQQRRGPYYSVLRPTKQLDNVLGADWVWG
jgi:hypothetical protein